MVWATDLDDLNGTSVKSLGLAMGMTEKVETKITFWPNDDEEYWK
jgi:hypothetical protein